MAVLVVAVPVPAQAQALVMVMVPPPAEVAWRGPQQKVALAGSPLQSPHPALAKRATQLTARAPRSWEVALLLRCYSPR